MKKTLVIVVSITAFVLLYFFSGQQKNSIDQQAVVSPAKVIPSVSDISKQNNLNKKTLIESSASAKKSTIETTEIKMDESVRQAVNEIVNTSSEGLTEVQTENGVVVDLEGRFQSVPVATIGADGEISITDYTSKVPDKK